MFSFFRSERQTPPKSVRFPSKEFGGMVAGAMAATPIERGFTCH